MVKGLDSFGSSPVMGTVSLTQSPIHRVPASPWLGVKLAFIFI
jgi:hypothetical protein